MDEQSSSKAGYVATRFIRFRDSLDCVRLWTCDPIPLLLYTSDESGPRL